MTTRLHISPDLALPLDAATGTFGILATKGAGKSNAAVVMAEEMHDAGIPWVAIDPKGDWWGIRSAGDGKAPGLHVPVLGGRHGDVPLDPTEGAAWADVVLEHRLTAVLDVSQFTKGEATRFLLAFGQRLFRQAEHDPLHLFLEEAERGDPIVITPAGLDALGDYEPLPTGQALIDHWMATLGGPEKKILQPLIDAWPTPMSKDDLAAAAGYDPSGGGFNNPLSRLRSLELVRRGTDIALTDDFAEAIR